MTSTRRPDIASNKSLRRSRSQPDGRRASVFVPLRGAFTFGISRSGELDVGLFERLRDGEALHTRIVVAQGSPASEILATVIFGDKHACTRFIWQIRPPAKRA